MVLAVCGGYQLLGPSYQMGDEELPGVGLVDLRTVREPGPRLIGNCAIEADLGTGPRVIAGFENHGGRTYLGDGERPLGRVLSGHGNNGGDGFEGVHRGNVIGTYLHGPLLPKNVWLADRLIELALGVELEPLDDAMEDAAHLSARRAAGVCRDDRPRQPADADPKPGPPMPPVRGGLVPFGSSSATGGRGLAPQPLRPTARTSLHRSRARVAGGATIPAAGAPPLAADHGGGPARQPHPPAGWAARSRPARRAPRRLVELLRLSSSPGDSKRTSTSWAIRSPTATSNGTVGIGVQEQHPDLARGSRSRSSLARWSA